MAGPVKGKAGRNPLEQKILGQAAERERLQHRNAGASKLAKDLIAATNADKRSELMSLATSEGILPGVGDNFDNPTDKQAILTDVVRALVTQGEEGTSKRYAGAQVLKDLLADPITAGAIKAALAGNGLPLDAMDGQRCADAQKWVKTLESKASLDAGKNGPPPGYTLGQTAVPGNGVAAGAAGLAKTLGRRIDAAKAKPVLQAPQMTREDITKMLETAVENSKPAGDLKDDKVSPPVTFHPDNNQSVSLYPGEKKGEVKVQWCLDSTTDPDDIVSFTVKKGEPDYDLYNTALHTDEKNFPQPAPRVHHLNLPQDSKEGLN